jgi:hypothetical protein
MHCHDQRRQRYTSDVASNGTCLYVCLSACSARRKSDAVAVARLLDLHQDCIIACF